MNNSEHDEKGFGTLKKISLPLPGPTKKSLKFDQKKLGFRRADMTSAANPCSGCTLHELVTVPGLRVTPKTPRIHLS